MTLFTEILITMGGTYRPQRDSIPMIILRTATGQFPQAHAHHLCTTNPASVAGRRRTTAFPETTETTEAEGRMTSTIDTTTIRDGTREGSLMRTSDVGTTDGPPAAALIQTIQRRRGAVSRTRYQAATTGLSSRATRTSRTMAATTTNSARSTTRKIRIKIRLKTSNVDATGGTMTAI